ncbi:28S ribosomal protein S5, mitochondrial [Coniosporium apollinis]|uniref:28S ribosomal protein S5, mitochondrial n=1 Tax=Coniosporium apollinis TaxID=61459 RepID=A0ABQ9NZI5_9PEZI|nr:28S ribosomal protein S5, mitochondrial [Coniosporium apollinis]
MSVSRPARCLFSAATSTSKPSPSLHHPRSFHTTTPRRGRRRPHYPSIKAADLEALNARAAEVPTYSESEKALLAKKYTPEQVAAIEAGEAAVDARDLLTQGALRTDPYKLRYIDDLSTIHPWADKQPRKELDSRVDYRVRHKSEREMARALINFTEKTKGMGDQGTEPPRGGADLKEQPGDWEYFREWSQFLRDPKTFMHANDERAYEAMRDESGAYSALAPELPKFNTPGLRYTRGEDEDPHMVRLMQQTGLTLQEIKRVRVKNLVSHRVVNQTRMGKIQSLYYLTIAGNQNGMLGIGEGKASEPEDGQRQAMMQAIRSMKPVPRYEGRTIFGEVEGKVGATELKISARPPGFGIRCQHLIFEMARAAGISDLAARVTRARNPMNTVKAAFEALTSQKLPEDIARARGRKLVDVRKVYYGGKVY